MAAKKKPGVHVTKNPGAENILKAMELLASMEVLVGFPSDTTDRQKEEGGDLTNAALGYIHDNGAPEQNIPARPFMVPGMTRAMPKVEALAKRTAKAVLSGAPNAPEMVEQGLHAMGLVAQSAIRAVINEGIDPPLADATLRARAAKGRKGAKQELANRKAGKPPGKTLAKPLVDTGQLRNAVNYVIRNRKKRSA